MTRFVFVLIVGFLPVATSAESCPGNPQALGTERVMEVNARLTPRVGRKHFPSTLPLNAKELVLTFDDGPWPGTTSKVLTRSGGMRPPRSSFRAQCRRPQLARRALAGAYAWPSQFLPPSSQPDGIAAGGSGHRPHRGERNRHHGAAGLARRRSFRFASNQALLDRLAGRGIVVFGADVWASDWLSMSPEQELRLILSRIEHAGRGIVLFHDTKAQTARMLPAFLRELKRRDFRVVHVVPGKAGGNSP
jgi:peptidoglycan/xylan/chitin deacetylase (PgdA/CDA1 family)